MIKVSIGKEFQRKITLHRYAEGSYVDGIWEEGAITDTEIFASVQPLVEGDYRRMPEGDSSKRGWKVFWNEDFQHGTDGKFRPDSITVDGILFEMSGKPDAWTKNGHSAATFVEVKNV